jgi:hypothetical protein
MFNRFLLLLIVVSSLFSFVVNGIIGFDIVDFIQSKLVEYYRVPFDKIFYIIVFIGMVVLMTNSSYYKSFLGKTEFPCLQLRESKPFKANIAYKIRTKPGTRIVYWAAEANMNPQQKDILPRSDAYGKYYNSGVAIADKNGIAILAVRKPQPFYTKMFGIVRRDKSIQINYKISTFEGQLGDTKTAYL